MAVVFILGYIVETKDKTGEEIDEEFKRK